jgi:hypothetical protein
MYRGTHKDNPTHTMRSTSSAGCAVTNPIPITPTWKTAIDFVNKYMKSGE